MPSWTSDQLDAINLTGKNIIVSAGAGSGKTAVLTERVITKIKSGISIRNLLILTFTNLAAGEMKDRIRSAIKKADLVEELNYIDNAYITTFDSFSLSIVKKYHYLLNITSSPKIVDSALISIKKKEILDSLFEELYETDKKFKKLIKDLCVKDDETIKSYILNINAKLDLKSDKIEYIDNYKKNYFNELIIEKNINEYLLFLKKKIKRLIKTTKTLEKHTSGEYAYQIIELLEFVLESNNYEEFKNRVNFKLPRLPKEKSELASDIRKNIKDQLDKIIKMCEYENDLEIKESIVLSSEYVLTMLNIIKEFDNRIKEYKYTEDLFEFNDIAQLAINVIKNNDFVRDEIKSNFKEILVDEYQDTSDLQEEFISLISDNNAYMVGDIKQSIYRFRNANPYIFKKKYDDFSNGLGIKIDLVKNFRSREEVLFNINEMFNIIMDDFIGGANYIESHQMVFGNGNYTTNQKENNQMDILEYEYDKNYLKEEMEAFIIVEDIINKMKNKFQVIDKQTNKLRNCTYSDFTILMDRSTTFDLYKKIFEYKQVPLSLFRTEKIMTSQDITVIKNILLLAIKIKDKKIDNDFKHYFLSIARSFLFKEDDNLLHEIIINKNYKDHIVFIKTKEIAMQLDNLSANKILDLIITKFNIYEKISLIGDVSESVIRISSILDVSTSFNPYEFGEYLTKTQSYNETIEYEAVIEKESVKLMNIHKSKGLEFSVCYFSGLYKEFNMMELKDKFIFDSKYGLIAPYLKDGLGTTIYKDLYYDNYVIEEISEKIRLFYVALTRAKEKIIVILPKKDIDLDNDFDKLRFKSFSHFFEMCRYKLDKYYKEVKVDIDKGYNINNKNYFSMIKKSNVILETKEINIENEEIQNLSFSKKTSNLLSKKDIDNINLGLEFHSILESIDLLNTNLDFVKNDFIKNKVSKFLDIELLKDKNINIYQEYEFMYTNVDLYHGIIDLMIEHADYIDIVDYKLKNISDVNYFSQLSGYKNYIEKLTNKKVNIYLYSILEKKLEKFNI